MKINYFLDRFARSLPCSFVSSLAALLLVSLLARLLALLWNKGNLP